MTDIVFTPANPPVLVECVDITIAPDMRVEFMETFSFSISPIQTDEAVQVGLPDTAIVTIADDDSESTLYNFDLGFSVKGLLLVISIYMLLTTTMSHMRGRGEEAS
jgi:hypothetical protein